MRRRHPALILSDIIGADVEKVSERITAGVRGARIEVKKEAALSVKISAGIASVARIGISTEVESLIQQARQAVMGAKGAGPACFWFAYNESHCRRNSAAIPTRMVSRVLRENHAVTMAMMPASRRVLVNDKSKLPSRMNNSGTMMAESTAGGT